MNWSTGRRKHVSRGDRVFLMRQGGEPYGLVGSGRIEGVVKQGPHWDPEKSKQGEKSWIVPVRWDTLSTTPIVARDVLDQETGEESLWRTRAGGVTIRPEIARITERLWSEAKLIEFKEASADPSVVNDCPTGPDRLGITRYANAFGRIIHNPETATPLTIGLYAAWGMGKSFLMEKIKEEMKALLDKQEQQHHDKPRKERLRLWIKRLKPVRSKKQSKAFQNGLLTKRQQKEQQEYEKKNRGEQTRDQAALVAKDNRLSPHDLHPITRKGDQLPIRDL